MKWSPGRAILLVVWLVTLFGAMVGGAYGHKHRDRIRAVIRSIQTDPPLTTGLYTLRVQKLAIPGAGRDGAIAALRDGILAADRLGRFIWVSSSHEVRPLTLVAPVNVEEFRRDPYNANTLYPELFGLKDLALQPLQGERLRVLVTHSHWHAGEQCNTLRVSALETTEDELLGASAPAGEWRTLYETTPCRPLEPVREGVRRAGLGVGGRIAPLPDGALLLTVGGFDPENELVLDAPQTRDNSYGKTIRIDPATGAASIYTLGHRNPQGLAVASDGTVWLTEHAARGGDELNLLREGGNYGYPRVTYGTQYEMMTWPYSMTQGRHDGYDEPAFAWTPSLGISQLIVLERDGFPHWRGDLVVSSLAAQSLFRIRTDGDRVRMVEPIPIGRRIRDIAEAADGSIVLKTDDDFLVYISVLDASTATTPVERGIAVAAGCQACHSLAADGASGIGPPLWGIVGRRVASTGGFEYSGSLATLGGRWTPERLQAYVRDPAAFAPGTLMELGTTYTEEQLADLIAYLHTLR